MMILKIAGVIVETIEDTVDLDVAMTYEIDEFRCQVYSLTQPSYEASVELSDDTLTDIYTDGVIFTGTITGVQLVDKDAHIWDITALDNTRELDSLLVVEEYSNQSASAIAVDLMSKYAPAGFTDIGILAGAPTVEFIQFNYKRLSECFKALCDYVGWQWYVDAQKVVHFFNADAVLTPAPIALQESTRGQFFDFRLSINTENIRNRIFVRGGSFQSPTLTPEEWASDGLQRGWTLLYKPHEITPYIAGVAKTVGIENVDDPATKDFLVNYQERRLILGTGTATPADGVTMKATYYPDIDVITVAENFSSQAALAAITGETGANAGVREHVIEDSSLVTIAAAEAAGNLELRKWADPEISASFQTFVTGWDPGQLITVNLPDRGLVNTYMIQKVHMAYRGKQWVTEVQFGGRLISIADFLQALVSQQQSSQAQTAILQKYVYVSEIAGLVDELVLTTKTGYWIYDDSDAIYDLTITSGETNGLLSMQTNAQLSKYRNIDLGGA